jgi:quercetin dioxygenase-like cupin family protein
MLSPDVETSMSSTARDRDTYSVTVSSLGATLEVAPSENDSGVAVVEHTLPPRTLGAPIHRHSREDEISYVLEGDLTVQADGEVTTVPAGEFVVKGRDVWHTFWNAGDEPTRFLEIIAPGEFAEFFAEIAPYLDGSVPDAATIEAMTEVANRYGLEMQWESVPELCERHGLAA